MTAGHLDGDDAGAIEREVKLDAPPSLALPDLTGVGAGVDGDARVTVRDAGPVHLDATYYDTANLALHDAGVSLRRRTGEGTRWTAKLPEAGEGDALGATVRQEIDLHDDAPTPPANARGLVEPYTHGGPLEPVARIVSNRRRLHVVDSSAPEVALLAEIDDDHVEVHAPGTDEVVARFREIEVEFASDAPAELVAVVVDGLLAAGATRSDGVSKVDRALALLGRT